MTNCQIKIFLAATIYVVISSHFVFSQKINGVSFVAPVSELDKNKISTVNEVNANYVALNPYGFSKMGKPMVFFNTNHQWWGETTQGTEQCIKLARKSNLKILLKPHIWTDEHGWPALYDLKDEATWLKWEANYRKFIMAFAHVAIKNDVEIFCIGTEFKNAALKRETFWRQLIFDLRKTYKGKITYAANWDDYQEIPFWDALDYIGVDAYFPLTDESTPSFGSLAKGWLPHINALKLYSQNKGKPVLFTEFGYRSIDKCAGKQWLLQDDYSYDGNANCQAQLNAYAVLFEMCWKQEWIAGGFLWKWYEDSNAGGIDNNDYTPQNKPASLLIKKIYSQYK